MKQLQNSTLLIYQTGMCRVDYDYPKKLGLPDSEHLLLDRSNQPGLAKNTVPRVSFLDRCTYRTESPLDWKLWSQWVNKKALSKVVKVKHASMLTSNPLLVHRWDHRKRI